MDNYPNDWFCAWCHKQYSNHLKLGGTEINSFGLVQTIDRNWCYVLAEVMKNDEDKLEWFFKPVDNLTQIELTAKQRGITKDINKDNMPTINNK
jgi:hypothetical protein